MDDHEIQAAAIADRIIKDCAGDKTKLRGFIGRYAANAADCSFAANIYLNALVVVRLFRAWNAA